MSKINYHNILQNTLQDIKRQQITPTILLHSCCAPCSSSVIEYLSNYFYVTVFYYNPNIDEKDEYLKRATEQKLLINKMPTKYPVEFIEGTYDVEEYIKKTKDLAHEKEGGTRCLLCYQLRLRKTAEIAHIQTFDYFTTTLTVSPLKNAQKLNEIGQQLKEEYGINYLFSDFKKQEGYKRSIELSEIYHLYRQNYCGCSYSKSESSK